MFSGDSDSVFFSFIFMFWSTGMSKILRLIRSTSSCIGDDKGGTEINQWSFLPEKGIESIS